MEVTRAAYLAPIMAHGLGAWFNRRTQELNLVAKVEVNHGVYGVNFRELIRIPELPPHFSLEAWHPSGPNIAVMDPPYEHHQKILLPAWPISGWTEIVIYTLNHPKGKLVKVPIVEDPHIDPPPHEMATISIQNLPSVSDYKDSYIIPPILDAGNDFILAQVGKPFDIKERVPQGTNTTLSALYDSKVLTMENCGYVDGNIVWTMNAKILQDTQFVVYGYGGRGAGLWRKVISINVFEANGPPGVAAAA